MIECRRMLVTGINISVGSSQPKLGSVHRQYGIDPGTGKEARPYSF
jgi:hypothetical protein